MSNEHTMEWQCAIAIRQIAICRGKKRRTNLLLACLAHPTPPPPLPATYIIEHVQFAIWHKPIDSMICNIFNVHVFVNILSISSIKVKTCANKQNQVYTITYDTRLLNVCNRAPYHHVYAACV